MPFQESLLSKVTNFPADIGFLPAADLTVPTYTKLHTHTRPYIMSPWQLGDNWLWPWADITYAPHMSVL